MILAAIAARGRRHEHRSWLGDLRRQILRGAIRTTGTLVATVVTVALLGAAFVFAASYLGAKLPPFTASVTNSPATTPTPVPSPSVVRPFRRPRRARRLPRPRPHDPEAVALPRADPVAEDFTHPNANTNAHPVAVEDAGHQFVAVAGHLA